MKPSEYLGKINADIIGDLSLLDKKFIDREEVKEAIINFNSTPNVWLKADVSLKAFKKLLRDLKIK